jgi:hypothetical protein
LITGLAPTSAEFLADRRSFLEELGTLLSDYCRSLRAGMFRPAQRSRSLASNLGIAQSGWIESGIRAAAEIHDRSLEG